MKLVTGLIILRTSAGIFPIALVAWGLMWLTDRLYESPFLWFLAVPIRIVILLLQVGFLTGCIGALIGFAIVTVSLFATAARGKDPDTESRLGCGGYLLLLLVPVAMGVSGVLVALFHNLLDFNERGLGLVTLGCRIFTFALETGSIVVVGVWLVVLPIFLWKRGGVPV